MITIAPGGFVLLTAKSVDSNGADSALPVDPLWDSTDINVATVTPLSTLGCNYTARADAVNQGVCQITVTGTLLDTSQISVSFDLTVATSVAGPPASFQPSSSLPVAPAQI